MTMKIKATTTAIQSRGQVFFAKSSLKTSDAPVSLVVDNKWATIKVDGVLLNQVHRGILDVIFNNYEPIRRSDEGSETFRFTMYDLQVRLGKKSTRNNAWMWDKLMDMKKVIFTVNRKDTGSGFSRGINRQSIFNILSSIDKIYDEENYGKMTDEEKEKANPIAFEITFSAPYMKFVESDTYIAYPELTPKILSIKCMEAQALARLCLSHKVINHQSLDNLMDEIGLNETMMGKSCISRSRRKIIAAKDELEEKLGIKILVGEKRSDPVKVVYHRDKTLVKFHNDDAKGLRGAKEYNEELAENEESKMLMDNLNDRMGDLFENGEEL